MLVNDILFISNKKMTEKILHILHAHFTAGR